MTTEPVASLATHGVLDDGFVKALGDIRERASDSAEPRVALTDIFWLALQTLGSSSLNESERVRVLRALLAARRESNALEGLCALTAGRLSGNELDIVEVRYSRLRALEAAIDNLVSLRADADAALYDAEVALGLNRDHANNPEHRIAARLGAQWPLEGIPIDAARRLLAIEMHVDLIERVMVANKRRDAEPEAAPSFDCANDSLKDCLAALAAKRIAELAALEVGR